MDFEWQHFSSLQGFSILADLNNAVVWTVSTRPLISKSSSLVPIFWWLYQEHQLQLV